MRELTRAIVTEVIKIVLGVALGITLIYLYRIVR